MHVLAWSLETAGIAELASVHQVDQKKESKHDYDHNSSPVIYPLVHHCSQVSLKPSYINHHRPLTTGRRLLPGTCHLVPNEGDKAV